MVHDHGSQGFHFCRVALDVLHDDSFPPECLCRRAHVIHAVPVIPNGLELDLLHQFLKVLAGHRVDEDHDGAGQPLPDNLVEPASEPLRVLLPNGAPAADEQVSLLLAVHRPVLDAIGLDLGVHVMYFHCLPGVLLEEANSFVRVNRVYSRADEDEQIVRLDHNVHPGAQAEALRAHILLRHTGADNPDENRGGELPQHLAIGLAYAVALAVMGTASQIFGNSPPNRGPLEVQ